jgi:predicted RNA-binding protein YlxR (DUF448 family)
MATTLARRPSGARSTEVGADRRGTATRRCIASGVLLDKRELLRFVVGPDGRVVPDLDGKLPGRGLWLSPRRDMIERACRRNLFARAARAPVSAPGDLAEQVARGLRRRCLDLIGLARRAGLVTAGYQKVRSQLAAGRAAVLVQAGDAAPGGRAKLAALARAAGPVEPVVEVFSAEELGRVLGRDAAVHVALAPGPLTDRFIAEMARLNAAAGRDNTETGT